MQLLQVVMFEPCKISMYTPDEGESLGTRLHNLYYYNVIVGGDRGFHITLYSIQEGHHLDCHLNPPSNLCPGLE